MSFCPRCGCSKFRYITRPSCNYGWWPGQEREIPEYKRISIKIKIKICIECEFEIIIG